MATMPFLRLLVPLIVGILFGNFSSASFPLMLGCGMLSLIFLVLSLGVSSKWVYLKTYSFALFVNLFLIDVGCFLMTQSRLQVVDQMKVDSTTVLFKLDAPLVEKNKSVQLLVDFVDPLPAEHAKVILYLKKSADSYALEEGDYLLVSAQFIREKKTDEQMMAFDQYLNLKGISGSFYIPPGAWKKVGHDTSFSFLKSAHSIQRSLVNIFREKGLDGDELSVVSALSIGDKSMLDKELKNSYSVAGASHILAVSGLHVGVVFWVFSSLLSWISFSFNWKELQTLLALLFLWMFTFVTGLSPSVVRASIMLSLFSLSVLIHRKPVTLNTVFASAFMMLLYSPSYLFDVGFQLSYVAVVSILLFQPPLDKLWQPQQEWKKKLWAMLSVSFAAQLGTLPLTLYYFHQVCNWFWLTGFVVIPISTLIIYGSMSLWVLQKVPYVSDILVFALQNIVGWLNAFVRWVESWSTAVVSHVRFETIDLLFFSLILVSLYFSVNKCSFYRIASFLILLVFYSGYHIFLKLLGTELF